MTPCKYEDRQRFENCLDEINSYDYPVYSAQPQQDSSTELQIDRLKIPNRTEPSDSLNAIKRQSKLYQQKQLEGFLSCFL